MQLCLGIRDGELDQRKTVMSFYCIAYLFRLASKLHRFVRVETLLRHYEAIIRTYVCVLACMYVCMYALKWVAVYSSVTFHICGQHSDRFSCECTHCVGLLPPQGCEAILIEILQPKRCCLLVKTPRSQHSGGDS